jgi:hypothetical protein
LKITAANSDGVKANFTACPHLRLPNEFLGPEYAMEELARQDNRNRIAASKAQKAQREIEI